MVFLYNNSLKKEFPKWDGLIDLKDAGITVPHAEFSKSNSTEKDVHDLVSRFICEMQTDLLALRPDGGIGIGKTPPGITFKKNEIYKIVQKVFAWNFQSFGVVLIDTHSRFDYDFCCNCLLDDDGSFRLEFVGPGFDGGDLNKSILPPTIVVQSKLEASIYNFSDPVSGEENFNSLERLLFRIDIKKRKPTQEEINIRLKYIATQLLPDMGVETDHSINSAIEWLKANNYNKLFDDKRSENYVSLKDLQEIILAASRYANRMKNKGQKINAHVLTLHKYNDKINFFGTFNWKKWG
jgi:hypothetical protein